MGYVEDAVFWVAISTYLCQPCPIMAPVVYHFLCNVEGNLIGMVLTWLLAATALPGQRHQVLHNKLQSISKAMMKLGSILSASKAINFLVDSINCVYIKLCVNHVTVSNHHPNVRKAPHAIILDIPAFNIPTRCQ